MKRAAVIGLGDISGIHLAAIAKNPEITLAAVCDIDESKREGAPAGVPFYTDYQEMVEKEKPDVVACHIIFMCRYLSTAQRRAATCSARSRWH